MAREIELELDPSVNKIFDETTGNSFLALRKLRWNSNSDFRLDIRKWFTDSNGNEVAGKGVSFMTPEGPSNLVKALLEIGVADTRSTLEGIKDRDDFLVNVKEVLEENGMDLDSVVIPEKDNSSASYYDPKSILG